MSTRPTNKRRSTRDVHLKAIITKLPKKKGTQQLPRHTPSNLYEDIPTEPRHLQPPRGWLSGKRKPYPFNSMGRVGNATINAFYHTGRGPNPVTGQFLISRDENSRLKGAHIHTHQSYFKAGLMNCPPWMTLSSANEGRESRLRLDPG